MTMLRIALLWYRPLKESLMKTNLLSKLIPLLLIVLLSCGNSNTKMAVSEYNGEYCADVTYKNSNTGNVSDYRLRVQTKNNQLIKIQFAQGWLDEDDFGSQYVNDKGFATFSVGDTKTYTVQIIGPAANCFTESQTTKQCTAKTKDGERCKHQTDNANQRCFQHQ